MIRFNLLVDKNGYKKLSRYQFGATMKHFLPSSIMLTPFLVRYYDEEVEDETEIVETIQPQTDQEKGSDITD